MPAPDQICLLPVPPVSGTIRPPGSKSITNRALVCAALAEGESTLRGALDSEDTRVMLDSLRRVGIQWTCDEEGTEVRVRGCGGALPRPGRAELFIANSGTTIRFLTAALATLEGEFRLDGVPRMRERPIGDLLSALQQLGLDARSEAANGCPPVVVQGHPLTGGSATVRGTISSQYLSGLLLAAGNARGDVQLIVDGELVSKPYVEITRKVMETFGVPVEVDEAFRRFTVRGARRYRGCRYPIEPDASAASYFWAAAAVTGGEMTVQGLTPAALQGDVAFCDCLQAMGCSVEVLDQAIRVRGGPLRGIDVDMNAISDTVQTLAAVALFADGSTRIRGVAHNRHKETDRIGDLARELRRLGATVTEHDDGLTIDPGDSLHGARLETYRDHRMAMSFAVIGLRLPGVVIRDPGCTEKTYPQFFADFARVTRAGLVSS